MIATPPAKPGAVKPTVIACEDAEAEVKVGAVGSAATTWKARVTSDAAAYCASPACEATISQVPTALTVTAPSDETVHAVFVVPAPRVYVTSSPDDAVASTLKSVDPKETFAGWANEMFWFSDPTAITCATGDAAAKFVLEVAVAVTVQVPVTVNVTTPPVIVHAPLAVRLGVTPEDNPVAVERVDTAGVYVPPGNGDDGTAVVKESACPACVIVIVCTDDVVSR